MCTLKILSINKKTPIKLIHAQDTGYSGLASVIAGRLLKIPVVITSHGIRHRTLASILTSRFGKILLKLEYNLDLFTLKNADSIIALNPEIKEYYEKISRRKVEFIPNPIKSKNFEFSSSSRDLIRKELGIDDKTKVIGFIGRLSPEKNLNTLLDAFSATVQNNSNLKLVIIGIGKQELQLKEDVLKKHIEDKVIFCGLRNDISHILSALDIFVLPSYTEGLSSSLLEAMSCGCAIICSDIPANRLLVTHTIEGLLFDPYKSKELKEAIVMLSTDDLFRSNLGNNAKTKAVEYDEDKVFPKILNHYSLTIKKKSNNFKK